MPPDIDAGVLQRVLACMPDGETGPLTDWHRHLPRPRRHIAHG